MESRTWKVWEKIALIILLLLAALLMVWCSPDGDGFQDFLLNR